MILYTVFGYKGVFGVIQRCPWFECVLCVNKPVCGLPMD